MEDTYELFTIRTQHKSFINYSYLGIDKASRKAFVVDPSWEVSQLVYLLDQYDASLKAILLTHSHSDHTNMVETLGELYSPAVYMSKKEAEFYRYHCERLITLEDAEQIWVGDTSITALVTPGHTQGSVCYWSGDNLFSGDTVFIEGCGLCNSEGGSAEEMYYSIRRLIALLPLHTTVYPGHSFGEAPGKDIRYLHQWNVYFQLDDIHQFVKFRNRKNNAIIHFK